MKFENRYSKLDRMLHHLAFSSINIQKSLAHIEDHIYAKALANVGIDRPVFITSLPRSGTTLLLEILGSLDVFSAHTYRQMPFILLPLLWDKISRHFRTSDIAHERAHGDGMTYSLDSVEGFEEILWHAFWPEKYQTDRINLWYEHDQDSDQEFDLFMRNHIRKILTLRSHGMPTHNRYVSKNNANISRIALIARMFPDAFILVPFRNPVDHIASMLRQHKHFNQIHAEDAFTQSYMKDIGHFDFGANFRPINFSGWLGQKDMASPCTANFWIQYWCAAFNHLLSNRVENLFFVSYENCCAKPFDALRNIGSTIGIDGLDTLIAQAHRFRDPVVYNTGLDVDHALVEQASVLHSKLLGMSIT